VPTAPLANSRLAMAVVFGFDLVQDGGGAGLHANYVAEEPEK